MDPLESWAEAVVAALAVILKVVRPGQTELSDEVKAIGEEAIQPLQAEFSLVPLAVGPGTEPACGLSIAIINSGKAFLEHRPALVTRISLAEGLRLARNTTNGGKTTLVVVATA